MNWAFTMKNQTVGSAPLTRHLGAHGQHGSVIGEL